MNKKLTLFTMRQLKRMLPKQPKSITKQGSRRKLADRRSFSVYALSISPCIPDLRFEDSNIDTSSLIFGASNLKFGLCNPKFDVRRGQI